MTMPRGHRIPAVRVLTLGALLSLAIASAPDAGSRSDHGATLGPSDSLTAPIDLPVPPRAVRVTNSADSSRPFSRGTAIPPAAGGTFTTHEGTWMNVDVSPDGATIVFDHLGDLYTLPIAGGTATRLTSGPAVDAEPRFSPDGKTIAFVREAREGAGLWLMDAAGGSPRLVAPGSRRAPTWSPDGQWIAASAGDTVRLHRVADPADSPGSTIGPGVMSLFSPDGNLIYAGRFERGGRSQLFVSQYDRATGKADPARLNRIYPVLLSADGTQLVGVVIRGATTALVVQDLARETKRWLLVDLPPWNNGDPDLTPFPRAGWLPGRSAFVISIRNKLWRVEMADGRVAPIPLTVTVDLPNASAAPVAVASANATARRLADEIQDVRLAPDGRTVAFVTHGRVWVQALPRGKPERLTPDTRTMPGVEEESSPAWSPDGRFLAFVSWGPAGTRIQRVEVQRRRSAETLADRVGAVDAINYSHDGSRLLVVRGLPRERLPVQLTWDDWRELVWVPATGGAPTSITWLEPSKRRSPAEAVFVSQPFTVAGDADRVYATTAEGSVLSARWDGSDRRPTSDVTAPAAGPDERWIEEHLTAPVSRPDRSDILVLRGARLITMRGTEVIERGDVVIQGDRIVSIGPSGKVPANARVIDVTGKTILPGYVDFARPAPVLIGPRAGQAWESLADLAYGVTTTRLTGAPSPELALYTARVNAGSLLGPRALVTGSTADAQALSARITAVDDRLWSRVLPAVTAGTNPGGAILDGRLPVYPLGDDLAQLLARTGVTYVPSLVSTDGHLESDAPVKNAYLLQGKYHEDRKLSRFLPQPVLDQATGEISWRPQGEDWFEAHAADAARFVAAGGRVAVASRGAIAGLGVHFELWSLAAGGLTPHEALRAGTAAGAEALGIADSVGALAPGMLAELQVLDRNPLENIRNTAALRYVMRRGHLYGADALNEIWPSPLAMPAPWWVEQRYVRAKTIRGPALPPNHEARARDYTVTPITTPRPKDPTSALPLVPDRTLRFTTDEGTTMAVDVSPDGKTILFDILGDLYTMPIGGGKATRITSGMAMDYGARYSPDGIRIVFVSDRSGINNLWLADPDGRNPRLLLAEPDTGRGVDIDRNDDLKILERDWDPIWMPDGQSVLSNGRRFTVGGKNDGAPMPPLREIEDNQWSPMWERVAFGRDPRYAYLANWQGAVVYDFQTERAVPIRILEGHRGGLAVSPDNRWLAYRAQRIGTSLYGLRLRNLGTGAERWLVEDLGNGLPDSYGEEPYAGRRQAFTPDGRAIVLVDHGKFWRVDIQTGRMTPIAFRAEVEQDLAPLVRFPHSAVRDTITAREIREAQLSPDGKQLAFIALGKLYLMDFPNGTPRRVTSFSGLSEHGPAWSPDGRTLAFGTYSDAGEGYLYRVEVPDRRTDGQTDRRTDGSAEIPAPVRITDERAIYVAPAFSPDGKRLVCTRLSWRALRDEMYYARPPEELVWLDANGGTPRPLTTVALSDSRHRRSPPQFLEGDTAHVLVSTYDERSKTRQLISVRWDGTGRRVVLSVPDQFINFNAAAVISPDGRYALLTSRRNLYLATLPVPLPDSLHIDLQAPSPSVPIRRVSRWGATYPVWLPDGRRFTFTNGHALFQYDVRRGDSLTADSVRAVAERRAREGQAAVEAAERAMLAALDTARGPFPQAYYPIQSEVAVRIARDVPRGTLVLRGARLVTMRGHEVIERGDLVIRDSRIVAVGPSGSVAIPSDATVVDLSGKTIIPGYVDLHDHIHTWDTSDPVQHQQLPSYLARLAYGLMTSRDAHTSERWVPYGDRVETGDLLGPRIHPTADASYEDFESLRDVRDRVRRRAEFYGETTYKMYLNGARKVRQWVAIALRDLKVAPTAHDNLHGPIVVSKMIDGYAGNEHPYFRFGAYRDFTVLAAASTMSFSHLAQSWGDLTIGQNYERDPRSKWDHHIAKGEWGAGKPSLFAEEGDETRGQVAGRFAARVVAGGGLIAVGAHGDEAGLGTPLEMQSIGRYMPPYDALRVGTINGARAIGLDGDVGSIEVGKLADLQILDKNPLDDLRNVHTMYRIVKNGRLYDPATLDELWPRQVKFEAPSWWWLEAPPASTPRAP